MRLLHFGFQEIIYDTSPFCIITLKLSQDLKENSPSISRFLGNVFENLFWYFWGTELLTLKNSFESELKHTAVGRSVWRQRKTRRYYFKQLSVWALALYKIMTVLVHKTVLKPTGFSCHSFSGLCKRSPDHPHWTSMQCLLTSGFEGNQQGPLHLLSPP